MPEQKVNIRNLGRHSEGHWIAEVEGGGKWIPVDRKWGSWQTGHETRSDVLPPIAAALQIETIKAERRER